MASNKQKMNYHLLKAEQWQARAEAIEAWAADKAINQQQGRLRRSKTQQDPDYLAKILLKDLFIYDRATGNRNAHQQQAIMYGIAALVEEALIDET